MYLKHLGYLLQSNNKYKMRTDATVFFYVFSSVLLIIEDVGASFSPLKSKYGYLSNHHHYILNNKSMYVKSYIVHLLMFLVTISLIGFDALTKIFAYTQFFLLKNIFYNFLM